MSGNLVLLAVALLAGIVLGLLYFGGLWITVNKLPTASNPLQLTLLSFIARLGICLAFLYLIIVEGKAYAPLNAFVFIVTFLLVRNLMVQRLQPQSEGVGAGFPRPEGRSE
ncbi:MAG: ATP synthase subunit I [Calothrix sp. MO_192.B10]|nr:ATP synthase subunit I [Calothrix sp. MO_192.B10]